MEVLIFLLALVPIALLVLMVVTINRVGSLSRELGLTREFMRDLAHSLRAAPQERTVRDPAPEGAPATWDAPPPTITPQSAPALVEDAPLEGETTPGIPQEPPADEPEADLRNEEMRADWRRERSIPAHPLEPPPPPAPPPPTFFERHPDLERFIGENLINKVGIAVLVVGLGLLMKYAVGRGLIGETGRTLIGLASGAVLVLLAHRLRNGFRAFSSVLVGGGVAVFYFSVGIAFRQYGLIGQVPAFVVMVLITGLAVALTLAYDRRELAVIALIGGFATPFVASTGEGNFRVLFTYLLILDAGMLVLANFKKWHIINILSFGLSLLIFGSWALGSYPGLEPRPSLTGFAFATAFFLVFFAMNLRYNLRHRQAFGPLDHALVLVNTGAYYGVGMHLLSDLPIKVTGLFTVLLGLFYLVFALHFHRREKAPGGLKLMLIGLVLTFVSLAAPVQLEGNHITLFWAAETVLLLWFAQRAGLRQVERGGLAVLGLMLMSLLMDLTDTYGTGAGEAMVPILNKGWMTGMAVVAALGSTTFLLRQRHPAHGLLPGLRAHALGSAAMVAGIGLLYSVNLLELRSQLAHALDFQAVNMATMAYSLLFLLVLERATATLRRPYGTAVAALLVVAAVLYVTGFYTSSRTTLAQLLLGQRDDGFLLLHYLAVALMAAAVVRLAILARKFIGRGRSGWDAYLWLMCPYLVILASQELDHLVLLGSRPAQDAFVQVLAEGRRAGYPLLWGLGSFLFMWYGMRQRMRMVRVIALCLFAITLLKLFLVDLGTLSEGGRVAAFILLGALLLVVSFMYQKLKGLLKEDAPDDDLPADA